MSSLNRVQLIGRLGADPEVRRLNSGDPVVSMRLATSERWTDKQSGEKKERTEWHSVVIFNKNLCEIAEKYLKKGNIVFVEGQLATRSWEDQGGQKRYTTEVVLRAFAGELILLPQGNGGRPGPAGPDDYGSEQTRSGGAGATDHAFGTGRGGGYADQSGGSMSRHLDDEIPF